MDEQAFDLLQPGTQGYGKHHIKLNEWEGHQIAGVQWIPVPSSQQLNEYYRGGSRNKTTHQNEFGELRDKAAQLFQIELT